MKKLVSVLLVITVLLSLGVTAMAAGSPTGKEPKAGAANPGMGVYDANDKRIAFVPGKDVVKYNVGNADKLDAEDKDAFLAAYEEAKKVEDKTVQSFFWLNIPDSYKEMDGFGYVRFDFTCKGENVQLTVNGNAMEVVHVAGIRYYAKLTEFGTICITSD